MKLIKKFIKNDITRKKNEVNLSDKLIQAV